MKFIKVNVHDGSGEGLPMLIRISSIQDVSADEQDKNNSIIIRKNENIEVMDSVDQIYELIANAKGAK